MRISKDEQEKNRETAALKRQEFKAVKAKASRERLFGRILLEVCPYVSDMDEAELRGFLKDMLE